MNIQFGPISFTAIREVIRLHLASLPSAIDSYLEDHIIESTHYQILMSGEPAGFTSIHQKSLITQFVLEPSFKQHGQSVYRQVKRMEEVQSAFVPTDHEFFLSHALDEYRQLAKQAYLFAAGPDAPGGKIPAQYALRLAQPGDIALIREESGDFFGDIEKCVGKQALFLTLAEEACVGFGIRKQSELLENVASIGMYVPERFRRQGIGTATLCLLREECRRDGLRPIAGCWYYNHFSKKTLERAGMFTQTRLLKIDY